MRAFLVIAFALLLPAAADLHPADGTNSVSFSIRNFGLETNGSFRGLKGDIRWDAEHPDQSRMQVSVDATTINTGNDTRDGHLRKEEYFEAEKYPRLSFEGTSFTRSSSGYLVKGRLTIKATTKDVEIPFTVTPQGRGFIFEGNLTVNRLDYGVGSKSMTLANDVKIHLKVPALP